MKHLRLAAWTVWFMLCWIGVAAAEPVSMVIGFVAATLKAGGIGAMLIKAAFGIALQIGSSLLQRAMAKRQPQPGISGQLQVGGNNSLSFVVGTYATAGSLEYTGEFGGNSGDTPNANHVQVVTVSDLPQGIIGSRIWINGQKCEIDFSVTHELRGHPVKEFRKKGKDYLWFKPYDGSQTTADPYLLDKFGARPEKPWLPDMIGRGLTGFILTARVNRKLLTSLPAARVEPAALPLYDPRKDSTVGGSGSHRWGVPSTYEPTSNPAVIIYNILRGIWYGGELLYGPAIPATRLPLASWFAAMNECDMPVGGEPQFRGGYEIKTAEHEPISVIQELLKGCNGKMIESGGVYKIHVGAPALPVAYITDEDFVVTDEQEFDPFPGLENTFNGASANYPDPEAGWEMKDAPQRLFPAFEAEDDGRRLLAEFQFNAVPFPVQVQRLMKSMVEDGRRFRKHRGTLAPWAFALEPMDTISWTSSREGYSSKLFQIESMDDQVNGNQAVAFRETDPADFDWNAGTDELPWNVGPLVPQWPVAQPMTGWQAHPAEIKDQDGVGRRPSIEVFFDGQQDDVRAVHVLVRLAADGGLVFDGEVPYGEVLDDPGNKSVVLNGVFLPDTDYQAQGEFVPYGGRDTEPSGWLSVRTPDIRLGAKDIYPIDIPGLSDDIRGWQEWAGSGLREIERRLEEYDLWMADQDFGNAYDRQKLRQQITATYEQSKAEWTYEVNVLAAADVALGQRIETLSAEVFDPNTGLPAVASAVNALETYAGPDGTLAQALTQLSASSTPGIVTEANFRMEAVAGPTGYSRIGLQTRQGGSGVWRGAAAFLDTPNDPLLPTRFVISANQTVVEDGEGNVSALFEGDTTYIDNARIRNLDADNINVDALTSTSGFFDNVYIDSSLQLGPNVVVTGAIAAGAITAAASWGPSPTPATNASWTVIGSTSIVSETGLPVLAYGSTRYAGNISGGSGGVQVALNMGGSRILIGEETKTSNGPFDWVIQGFVFWTPPSGPGTYTIALEARTAPGVGSVNGGGDAFITAQCNRR